ncbi:hypothetical protein [Aquimarina sp. 2201CG5-10]|uniref:hypothetical protein n=1 Tax=Aquimarina callyspongiae TaxID=3098150 RepID=UPI002AB5D335|nr:hypothetical protein [Aquimarina sp. 2201CG5-10]MDY8138133.1 hypothetical protein [Aquimarina sp. 2201CG5-10]
MYKDNKSNSILNNLTTDEIRELYYDYELQKRSDDFEFYYIIDADELVDYCYPKRNKNKSDSEIADEQFIIEYLFLSKRHKIIIIDDYIKEIFDLRSKLLSIASLKNSKKEIEYHLERIEYFVKVNNENQDNEDYFENLNESLSYLMYISEGKYVTNLSKLNYLLSHSILYESKSKIMELEKAFKLYNKDVYKFDGFLKIFDRKEISKHNDVNGILKTYFLSSHFENQNKIFYFLSSSTTGIKKIKKRISNLTMEEPNKSKNRPIGISVIRNKPQLFAQLIFNTFEFGIKDFNSFSQAIDKITNRLSRNDSDSELIALLKENRNTNLEIIENYTIINNRKEKVENEEQRIALKVESFERLFRIRKTEKDKKYFEEHVQDFIDRVNSLVKEANLIDVNRQYQETKKMIDHLLFEMDVIDDFLANELYKKDEIKLDRGADPIESIFSAFPILFEYDFYAKRIFPTLLDVQDNIVVEASILTSLPRNCFDKENSRTYVLISYILYMLLLVRYEHPTRRYSNNFIVFNYVKKIIKNIKLSKKHKADIYAIGCWAARRCRKYKFAYELSIEAIEYFPLDPRFDFSLALTGYCWRYEFDTIHRYEWEYAEYYDNKKILNYCEEGILKLKKREDITTSSTVKHLYLALLNLTAFSYAAAYKIELDQIDQKQEVGVIKKGLRNTPQKYLKKSRDYINELKKCLDVKSINDKKEKMEKLPEYIHTEVFLEYYELRNSLYFPKDTDTKYRKKIIQALMDIRMVIDNCGKNRQGLKRRCERLLDKLKSLYNNPGYIDN